MSAPILLLRHRDCRHAVGMANVIGRALLETQRAKLALAGSAGWEIAEEPDHDAVATAIGMPWPPCGTCARHDLLGHPHLLMGGPRS